MGKMRILGKTGLKAFPLGFGTMRLETKTIGSERMLDLDKAVDVIRYGFKKGINYVDSAFFYCGRDSELALGRALEGWREQIIVTTKAPPGHMQNPGDLRRMLEYQLRKLNTSYLDFYCFHSINWDFFHSIEEKSKWIKDMLKAKEEKLVRHIGFSFHGKPEDIKKLIDLDLFEMMVCQYNYLDNSNVKGMKYAQSKGLAVIIMGPLGGGRLTGVPEFLKKSGELDTSSAAGLALRYVLSNPHVDLAMSGMSTRQMVDENIEAVNKGSLNTSELKIINRMMKKHKKLADLYCTKCQYCMPCPQGVSIARRLEAMNYYRVYGLVDYARNYYKRIMAEDSKTEGSGKCIKCRQCEKKCPQNIKIIRQLKETEKVLG